MPKREGDAKVTRNKKWNLAVLLSHPIQYHVPLMRLLAAQDSINLTVFFMTDTGLREKYIEGFGETIKWDVPLLEGYRSRFLRNFSPKPDKSSFWSKFNPGIIRELSTNQFDALIIHSYSSPTEWLALLIAQLQRIPVFFRGEVVLGCPKGWFPPKWLKEILLNLWCRRLSAALAINSAAKRFYEHHGVPTNRLFWAPYCVDNDFWMAKAVELAPNKAKLKKKLGIEPDLPVVLFVAHMRANKRPLDLVHAFERIRTPASLVMVGGGPLYQEVEDYRIKHGLKRVYLFGARNQTELPIYYSIADLFVLPSGPGEVSPLVVNEAMCFGLPVIMTDAIPSACDFVDNAANGYIYRTGQVSELAIRIDEILADEPANRRMGDESKKIIAAWNYGSCAGAISRALAAI